MLRTKTFMLHKYKYLYLYLTVGQEASQVLHYASDQNTSVSGGNGLPKEAFLLSDNLYDDKRESIFCANWLYSCSLHWFGTLGFLSNSK